MDDLDLGVTIKGFAVGQKVFHRYSLKKILGRGGMGVVWLARDDTLEIDVALKFLPEVVAMDKEAIRDLKRETRRSLELTHPHIIRIYDFVQDGRAAAISMEFVPGDTLAAMKVDRGGRGFEPAEIERWVQQLCEALAYAHERALVVHRDLKPANLMIDAHGDLKIADFGIAASVSDSVSRVSVRAGSSGTPVYMSPQQMMGDKPAVTDDIYSVGATLYDLITGRPPFYSGNIIAQVQGKTPPRMAARRQELEREPGVIPESWERTVAACLAKEPAERPQRAAEVYQRIRATVTAEPPPLPKAKPAEPAPAPKSTIASKPPGPTPGSIAKPAEPAPATKSSIASKPPGPAPVSFTKAAEPAAAPKTSIAAKPPGPAPVALVKPAEPAAAPQPVSEPARPATSEEKVTPAAFASKPAEPAAAAPVAPTTAAATPPPEPKSPAAATSAERIGALKDPGAEPIAADCAPANVAATPTAPQPDSPKKVESSASAAPVTGKHHAGGEVPKVMTKPPMGETAVAKPLSSVRYAPGGEVAASARKSASRTTWYIAAAASLVVVGAGYYFLIHQPAVERARVAAIASAAQADLDRLVTEVRASLGRAEWASADTRLAELDQALTTWPTEVRTLAEPLRAELRDELKRGREVARMTALRVPVTLTTTPIAAEVLIEGSRRGLTPLRNLELPLGEHAATLRLRDHEDLVVKFMVTEKGQAEWTWPLVRSRGWVQVAGVPQGAGFKIYPLDANGVPELMPAAEGRLPAGRVQLPVGNYEVVLASAGSGPAVESRSRIQVRREDVVNVNGDVRGASIRLTTTPAGATVLVGGKVEGTTPLLLAGQPYNARQQIEVRLADHETVRQEIRFPASADEVGTVNVVLSSLAGSSLRPVFAQSPARLMVENRARFSMTMRSTTGGQESSSGPTESTANSRELFTLTEPGPDGLWQHARSEVVQAEGFQSGTVVGFTRTDDRWVGRFERGGFATPGMSADYLYPSYPGLAFTREVLPPGRAEVGKTWDVPLSATPLVVPGSWLRSPRGSIKARVKAMDPAATPAWAEIEYTFDVVGPMEAMADNTAATRDARGREVGTLVARLLLQEGYVAQARLDKRTTVEGTMTTAAGAPASFSSEIITTVDTTVSIPTGASSSLFTAPGAGDPPPAADANPPVQTVTRPDATIYELAQVTRVPRAIQQTPPTYPASLQRAGTEGSVKVEFVVDRNGAVQHVRVLETTHPAFEAPALAAVRTWRFAPAQKDGQPVAVRVRTEVSFNLAE